ncbi:MAG: hypothetical protein EB027_06910 [Actinobacteria bacterium]|nr:hypothetical protein [Actinomycetota bacterium]
MMTAESELEVLEGLVRNGIHGLVIKPFEPSLLVCTVEIAMRKSSEMRGLREALRSGGATGIGEWFIGRSNEARLVNAMETQRVSYESHALSVASGIEAGFASRSIHADRFARFAVTIAAAAVTAIATGTTGGAGAAPASAAVFSGSARLNNKDLTSQANANSAVTAVDAALAAVNSERSTMGSVMSRLTHAVDNLTSVAQNATESRSRIVDTDYAAATTKLSKAQIIQQAATAMLAQANQQPQTVLALLK